MAKTTATKIFLSHAAADLKLVEAFETLLTKALNITSESIFCSSLEGQGATKGKSFVDKIKDEATAADAVVALITPAYMESAFCLAELGAAWVLNTNRFPIVVPPNTFEVMQATLLGVVGVKLDNDAAMSQLFEDITTALKLPPAKAGVIARAMRSFTGEWPTLQGSIGVAKRVDAAIHNQTLAELKSARDGWEASEQDLENAKAQISALKKTKDAAEVAKVSKAFSDADWEMDLDAAIAEVADVAGEVGGNRVIRLMILDVLNKPSAPDLNDDYISRAVEIGVYDTEDKDWIRSSDEMKSLQKGMRKVDAVFEEHAEAAAELKRRGKRTNPNDIRFWEEQVDL